MLNSKTLYIYQHLNSILRVSKITIVSGWETVKKVWMYKYDTAVATTQLSRRKTTQFSRFSCPQSASYGEQIRKIALYISE